MGHMCSILGADDNIISFDAFFLGKMLSDPDVDEKALDLKLIVR